MRYEQVSRQAFRDWLAVSGFSEAMTQAMLDRAAAKESGLGNGVSRTPRSAIGTPTTFSQWCEDTLKPAVQAA